MNLQNEILDLTKAIANGIQDGFSDLINWNKPARAKPAEKEDTSSMKYIKYPEWRIWGIREVTAQIVVILVLLIIIRGGIGEFRYIPSESMEPTMKVGDKLFVEKFSKVFYKNYNRGDIVIFYPPAEATEGKDVIKWDPLSVFARLTGLPFLPQPEAYIKRVIGVPGDIVQIRKNEGVYINGEYLQEPYYNGSLNYIPEYETKEIKIPEGFYLVLGDNRNFSFDSHYWGLLPKSRVIGRAAFLIYRPLNEKPKIFSANK